MSGCKMPCFKRNWFRADLREMARSCSNLQQATNCTNVPKTVRLKCSNGVGYGYVLLQHSPYAHRRGGDKRNYDYAYNR